jgi:Protein kinase domain
VDRQYEQYCVADPFFYDFPHGDRGMGRELARPYPISARPLPAGWRRAQFGDWLINVPPDTEIPRQGWKIHVSACLDNAEQTLIQVWRYCVPRTVSFKFLPSRLAVLMRNAKYAPRAGSGKVVTIYPADEAACELILSELDQVLGGAPGPYILSDLRYGAGPLYVRYGGFAQRYCLDTRGELVPAIENPAGELVPDARTPVFALPSWVRLPDFLAPHAAARDAVTVAELPYDVERALHFSNGGGVYAGVDKRTGERVILKEARPHAGLAADGSDAVERLRREHDMLRRVAGLGVAPEVRGYFQIGEHHFLAEEFIDGVPLNSCYADRYPLTRQHPDPADVAGYTSWAVRIAMAVERATEAVHERGVIFNDLHMFNVMVRPDDSVALIDFEAASLAAEGRRLTVGNPGFVAPRDRAGEDVDAYSVACLRLAMFMPLTSLLALDAGKAAQLAEVIGDHFPVPAGFLDRTVREITRKPGGAGGSTGSAWGTTGGHGGSTGTAGGSTGGTRGTTGGTWGTTGGTWGTTGGADGETTARSGYECFAAGDQTWSLVGTTLARAIRASATPARSDRLFPGDIEQFAVPGGGLALGHGAAGVLYALSEAVGVRVPEYEQWLIDRAADPAKGSRLGLYDGLAGVAYTLWRLGHAEAAVRTASVCLEEEWERLGVDLYAGLAGFSLVMLALGDGAGEPSLRDAGLKAAEIVAGRVPRRGSDRAAGGASGPGGAAGLLRGASGQALLFVRLYERTGDPAYLDAADAAIAADLDRCVIDRKGSLQVDDGWRVLPYLNAGSAGIGMVIDRFLAHRPGAACVQAAETIRVAARSTYYAQAGLFNGRAGLILYLAGQDRRDAARHVPRLAWHAVRYVGGLAFPGDALLRLSMDLGTGTAGVLLATAAALAPGGAALPFLGPPADRPAQSSSGPPTERVMTRR